MGEGARDDDIARIMALVNRPVEARGPTAEAHRRRDFGAVRQLRAARQHLHSALGAAVRAHRAVQPYATRHETIRALRDFLEAQPLRRRRAMERDLLALALDQVLDWCDETASVVPDEPEGDTAG